MIKRAFDFVISLIGLILLSPFFLFLIVAIRISSKGGAFYKQTRVGQFNRDFGLFKFRSMYINSDQLGLLTVGNEDKRITPIGLFIRKYKLDELPQLINVLLGEMSLVGPRPEVRRYVDLYPEHLKKVLDLKPGITDMASIKYKDENDLLSKVSDPEIYYIEVIMPDKLKINLEYYARTKSILGSVHIIYLTIKEVFYINNKKEND